MRDLIAAERFYSANRKKKFGIFLVFCTVMLSSIMVFPGSLSTLIKSNGQDEICKVFMKFNDLYRQKDIEGLMTFYADTPNVFAVSAGMQPSVGFEAIRGKYQREFAEFNEIRDVAGEIFSCTVSEDIASLSAMRHITAVKGDRTEKISGFFTAVLRKKNENWLFQQTHFSILSEHISVLSGKHTPQETMLTQIIHNAEKNRADAVS